MGYLIPLVAFAVVLMLFIPAVSAETIIDETISKFVDTSDSSYITSVVPTTTADFKTIVLNHIEQHSTLNYVGVSVTCTGSDSSGFGYSVASYAQPGRYEITYSLDGQASKTGVMYVEKSTNAIGTLTGLKYTLFFDEWDIGTLTGRKAIVLNTIMWRGPTYSGQVPTTTVGGVSSTSSSATRPHVPVTITVVSSVQFNNHLFVSEDAGVYNVELTRIINGRNFASTLNVSKDAITTYYNYGTSDINTYFSSSEIDLITITTPDASAYIYPITDAIGEEPSSATLNLYVRSSQTNALIADARAVIEAGFNDPADLQEVSNSTLPAGTKTYTLQPNGGGLPNPDFYRVTVTADGYNAEMPYADITLEPGLSMTMIMPLEPTSGGPEDPEETYVEFYVRDINANPLANAIVKCGGYTLMTNSAGFTQFDLPKNATYSYTVRKTGYMTMEGTVTVGAASRYPVNVVLGAGELPTLTPGPTVPGATPTPDRRTNEEKGQSIIDMIADNAEGIAALAIIGTLLGLLKLIAKW